MPKIDRSIVQGLSTADCDTDDAKRSKLDALAEGYKPVPAEDTPFFTGQEGRNYADVEEIDFDAVHENASTLKWDSVINDDDAAEEKAKQRSARRAKAAARKASNGQRAGKGDEVRMNSETALSKTLTAARAARAAEQADQPVKEKPKATTSSARLAFDKEFAASYRAAYEFHAAHWPPPSRDAAAAYNKYWDRFNADLAALKDTDGANDLLTWLLDAVYLAADFYDS